MNKERTISKKNPMDRLTVKDLRAMAIQNLDKLSISKTKIYKLKRNQLIAALLKSNCLQGGGKMVPKRESSTKPGLHLSCVDTDQGVRESMEDKHTSLHRGNWHLFAVFDGHAGAGVSSKLVRMMPQFLDRVMSMTDKVAGIADAFLEMDQTLLRDSVLRKHGSTATIAIADTKDQMLYLVNLGDSRTILSVNGRLIFQTTDHIPELDSERERILKSGGFISKNVRVNGYLNLSRAFGDVRCKENKFGKIDSEDAPVCAVPDVTCIDMTQFHGKLQIILASDGLWNNMSSQQVASFLKDHAESCDTSCSKLVRYSQRLSNHDNVTVMKATFVSGV